MATVTWIGGGGDSLFSNGLNWDTLSAPSAGDDVVFDGAFPITGNDNCTWDATTDLNSVDVQSGYGGNITASTTVNVTNTTGSFIFAGGSTLDFAGNAVNVKSFDASSGATHSLTMGSSVFTCSGSLNLSGGALTFNSDTSEVIIADTATVTLSSGKSFYKFSAGKTGGGTSTITLGSDITVTNVLNLNANASTRTINSNTIFATGDVTNSTSSGDTAGSTIIEFSGGANQSWTPVSGSSLGNPVVINKSGNALTYGDTIRHSGDYTFTAGTVSPNSQLYNRTGSGNVSGGTQPFYNFQTTAGATTLTGNLAITNDLTIDNSTSLAYGSNTITLGGDYSNSGTVTPGGTFVFASTTSPATIFITGGVFNNVQFTGSTIVYELQSAITANGDLTIGSSCALDVKSGGNYQINVGGDWANSGIFQPRSGTVVFDSTGTGNTIDDGGSSWNNVTFNGSGGGWSFSNSTIISGDLVVSDGNLSGTVDIEAYGNVTGNGVISLSGGAFKLQLIIPPNFGGNSNWTFYDLSTLQQSGTQTVTKVGSGNITVSNDLNIAASTGLNAGDDTWTITGSMLGDGVLTPGTSTFIFNGGAGESISNQSGTLTFYNLTFDNGSGTWDLAPSSPITITHVLDITNGIFDINSNNLTASGATFSNAGTLRLSGSQTVTGLTVDADSGSVVYEGSGTTGLAAGNAYFNLYIIGSSATWTLNANLDVNGSFVIGGSNTVNAGSNTINIAGDYAPTGTVNYDTSTVIFDGTSSVYQGGAFYNLTLEPGSVVHLAPGYTFSVTNDFVADACTLDSTTPATQATLNIAGTDTVSDVDATDIDSSGGNQVDNVGGTNTNTINWINSAAGTAIKTINDVVKASVKTVNDLAIASVKTWNGLA